MPDELGNPDGAVPREAENREAARLKSRESREILRSMFIFGAGMLLLSVANAIFAVWLWTSSQHAWCSVLNTLNSAPAPKGSPPPNAVQRELAREFRDLEARFGC